MIRKVKTLALALLAISALGAVIASAASAEFHVKDMGAVTGEATQLEKKTEFTIPEGALVCKTAIFNLHTFYNVEGGVEVDKETTATTVTVKVEEPGAPDPQTLTCTFAGLSGSIVHMNGCDFRFHATAMGVQATVICPTVGGVQQQITITAIVAGVLKCTIHIPEQGELQGLTLQNTKTVNPNDIDLASEVKGIQYTSTQGQGLGACAATQAGTDGQFKGTVTVKGKAGGSATDIWYE